jgi:hypothetical protein
MANIFPRWSNFLPLKIVVCTGAVAAGVTLAFTYYATPKTLVVGYQPAQPIPFSHKIHVDQIGVDCRYCHAFVEVSGHATVPAGSTCWNCHQHIQRDSPKLAPLHQSMNPAYPGYHGKPIEWVRVHKTPDFVYFNHSAHVNRGVACQSCHGNVNTMQVISQDQSLAMSWCLDCHRTPENFLRPLEEVYHSDYNAEAYLTKNPLPGVVTSRDLGLKLKERFKVNPKISCTTCHR